MSEIEQLYKKSLKSLLPPPELKISEWADSYRMLSSEAASKAGQWKTSFAEYQREMMDVVCDRRVERIIVRKSSQVGASEILNNIIGYYIHQDPSPILLLQPTLDFAEEYAKDRISPMIRNCKALREKIPARHDGNTLTHKNFPGGRLTITGANSTVQLASRSIRILCIDEVDRMRPTNEGDACKLAEKRTTTFFNRKIYYTSTPTNEGASRIDDLFEDSDQRHYYVPCPICGHFQILVWKRIEWKKKDGEHYPETAYYTCLECDGVIQSRHRDRMVKKGKWKAHEKFLKTAGFQINELYSPWRKWWETVSEYLEARRSEETLQVWTNTAMGESHRAKGEAPEWKRLYQRREGYGIGTIPQGVVMLTAGVDVQRDRLHMEVVGWGPRLESWSINYIIIPGDTAKEEVWEKLDDEINKIYDDRLYIKITAVDSGDQSEVVYRFVKRFAGSRVIAVKGFDKLQTIIDTPRRQEIRKSGKKKRQGLRVWGVGVSHCKTELYGFLRLISPESYGFCHFPNYPESYFKELTAEHVIEKLTRGYKKLVWEKLPGRANEALDCRVYARAAAALAGVDRLSPGSRLKIPSHQASEKNEPKVKIFTGPKKKKKIIRKKSDFWH